MEDDSIKPDVVDMNADVEPKAPEPQQPTETKPKRKYVRKAKPAVVVEQKPVVVEQKPEPEQKPEQKPRQVRQRPITSTVAKNESKKEDEGSMTLGSILITAGIGLFGFLAFRFVRQ